MNDIRDSLLQFVLRLTIGLVFCMWLTNYRQVTSGFFRVHLWVAMGLATFASLLAYSGLGPNSSWTSYVGFGACVMAVVSSYIVAAIWLYEASRTGSRGLLVVLACLLIAYGGACRLWDSAAQTTFINLVDTLSSALLMGSVLTAMLLGHWYLNTPSMKLEPLQKLVALVGIAVVLRVATAALGYAIGVAPWVATGEWGGTLLALRAAAGILGPGIMAALTWQTLKIPNTQSATGILYAAVILVFLGELSANATLSLRA